MSDEASAVSVEALRQAMNEALDRLQEAVGDTVEVDRDMFWDVRPEVRYDVYTQPGPDDLTVGQVTEAWDNVSKLRAAKAPMHAHSLVWLADVLRAVGSQHRY